MKYTFLLPAYKIEFLSATLASIKEQTYEDFKCIVSDDCSPEDIKSVFDTVCSSDARFSYRRNETNIGSAKLVQHWNLLVDLCDTDYFILASDDDIYHKDFLQRIDELAVKHPEAGLLRAKAIKVDENLHPFLAERNDKEFVSQSEYAEDLFGETIFHCMQNNVFKTSVVKGFGGCVDFPHAWCSDDATTILAAANGAAYTRETLFRYRISTKNITSINSPEVSVQKIIACRQFRRWYVANFGGSGLVDKRLAHLVQKSYSTLRFKDFVAMRSYLKEANYRKSLKYYLQTIYDWVSRLCR